MKHKQIKVVIAEDELLIRNYLVKKIETSDLNFHVIGAANDGKSALELIELYQPDLVVTDIRMPVMDGLELIKTLHLHFHHIKKIIISGFADFEYAQQAIRYNIDEYLLKPVKPIELNRALMNIKLSLEDEKTALIAIDHSGDPREIVHAVQQYIRENFNKELNMVEISSKFNFKSSYLSKIFIKYTGELPSKYLTTLRINEAKYLLTNNKQLAIKEVGELVGYPDQFYFSRIFKQVTGLTPKGFQQNEQS
ncbi:response regulator transcription factor [Paenibacillus oryzisoli]|uniref:DNA-binding response regulator n=1 Tax=Paenibacillus oryzisoli TaxID=1850517 RepID=A0A197ZWS8_9BACL|nr:response regulator [Paenibacillus oryzisoli]OAS13277.1 hypothetical protein A8708_10795 [Paenibacillus oryzisoli]